MQTSWTRVDLTRVHELRHLVAEARSLPTGAGVMDGLAKRPTNLRVYTDADWLANPHTADRAGTYDPETVTMHLPERVLRDGATPEQHRDALLTFVHESVHRTQQPVRLPRVANAVEEIGVAPWRRVGRAIEGAANALAHGQSPVRGARTAVDRDILQVEVEAADVEQRLAAEIARRDGRPLPPQLGPEAIYEWIRPNYGRQVGKEYLAGALVLGSAGTGALFGVRELHRRVVG